MANLKHSRILMLQSILVVLLYVCTLPIVGIMWILKIYLKIIEIISEKIEPDLKNYE